MKKIELFERAIAEQAGSLKEYGITEVNANYTDWQTNKRAGIPAIRMKQN